MDGFDSFIHAMIESEILTRLDSQPKKDCTSMFNNHGSSCLLTVSPRFQSGRESVMTLDSFSPLPTFPFWCGDESVRKSNLCLVRGGCIPSRRRATDVRENTCIILDQYE